MRSGRVATASTSPHLPSRAVRRHETPSATSRSALLGARSKTPQSCRASLQRARRALRSRIESICAAVGIPIDQARRAQLARLDAAALGELHDRDRARPRVAGGVTRARPTGARASARLVGRRVAPHRAAQANARARGRARPRGAALGLPSDGGRRASCAGKPPNRDSRPTIASEYSHGVDMTVTVYVGKRDRGAVVQLGLRRVSNGGGQPPCPVVLEDSDAVESARDLLRAEIARLGR